MPQNLFTRSAPRQPHSSNLPEYLSSSPPQRNPPSSPTGEASPPGIDHERYVLRHESCRLQLLQMCRRLKPFYFFIHTSTLSYPPKSQPSNLASLSSLCLLRTKSLFLSHLMSKRLFKAHSIHIIQHHPRSGHLHQQVLTTSF